jgi:hypothetical protein
MADSLSEISTSTVLHCKLPRLILDHTGASDLVSIMTDLVTDRPGPSSNDPIQREREPAQWIKPELHTASYSQGGRDLSQYQTFFAGLGDLAAQADGAESSLLNISGENRMRALKALRKTQDNLFMPLYMTSMFGLTHRTTVNTYDERSKKYEEVAKELFTSQNSNMDRYYDTKISLESAILALEQECEAVSSENRHYHTAEKVRRGLDAQSRMVGPVSAHAEAENYLRNRSVGSTGVP